MVWYEVKRGKGSPPQFIRHEIVEGRDTGIGTQFEVTDINGDGLPDIVLSNKKGVNILTAAALSSEARNDEAGGRHFPFVLRTASAYGRTGRRRSSQLRHSAFAVRLRQSGSVA